MKNLLAALLAIPLTLAVRALVLMYLWSWFIVDTFNAPRIGWLDACGLVLVVRTLTHYVTDSDDDEPVTPARTTRGAVVACFIQLIALGVGAIVALAAS